MDKQSTNTNRVGGLNNAVTGILHQSAAKPNWSPNKSANWRRLSVVTFDFPNPGQSFDKVRNAVRFACEAYAAFPR